MNLRTPLCLSLLALASAQACGQSVYAPSVTEYNRSTTVQQLKIKGIHSSGIIGQGVVVGVLDTGLNLSNPEFAGNVRVRRGYNATNGSSDVSDSLGHGTHVAGIIAASGNGLGMYGVAPGAVLLPVKVFSGNSASSASIDRGLAYASAQGAKVINLSLGATGPTGTAGLARVAATNNTLVVAAAGNNGAANPVWPARYANAAWANGTLIAVGAVDANRNIASFSNRAGDTANFYLVAPGVNILSAYGSGYAYMSGTSMAAPAVSGAAALLFGYWPYLKASQVAAILLNTADDLGAKGTDAVYGRGMLNVNRALSPQGSFTYKAVNGAQVTIRLQSRVVSTQPRVASPSAFGGLTTEVFDEYGRNFTSDEGSTLASRSHMTLDSALGRTDQMLDAAERALPNGARLVTLQTRSSSVMTAGANFGSAQLGTLGSNDPWNHSHAQALASMSRLNLASGHTLSAGDGGLSTLSLGLMNSDLAPRLSGAEGLLANPLLGFAPNHRFAAATTPITTGWSTRVALVRSSSDQQAAAHVDVVELMHQGRGHALNVSLGFMDEQGLLGGYSNAAMGLAQNTQSQGMTVSGALALSGPWTLAASWSVTHTQAPQASGMLLSGTAVRAQGWGVGLLRADTWLPGDRLSFTLNAPLRATSGSLTYSVIEGVNPDDGSPLYGIRTVQLKPTAREWLAEARYTTRLSAASSLTAVAAYRQHPDHDAQAPSQVAVGVRYQLSY